MTLGQVLKSKRLELGKSIEQIATSTRVHVKVLRALENDEYGDLPARAFTRGFIISYCKTLQINHAEIMRDYHDFLESKFAERPEKDHGHQGYAFESKENEQNKRGMIIIASVAAFFAILTLLFFKPQNNKHKEKHKELIAEEAEMTAAINAATPLTVTESGTETGTTTVAAITTPTETPSPSVTPTPQPTPKEDLLNKGDAIQPKDVGVKITFFALEDTLIHYHSDQRKPFSIMLRKDKQLVIKASELIKVQTETPDHLKYKVSFKNKAASAVMELKEQRLELHPDGSQSSFDAGAL